MVKRKSSLLVRCGKDGAAAVAGWVRQGPRSVATLMTVTFAPFRRKIAVCLKMLPDRGAMNSVLQMRLCRGTDVAGLASKRPYRGLPQANILHPVGRSKDPICRVVESDVCAQYSFHIPGRDRLGLDQMRMLQG